MKTIALISYLFVSTNAIRFDYAPNGEFNARKEELAAANENRLTT